MAPLAGMRAQPQSQPRFPCVRARVCERGRCGMRVCRARSPTSGGGPARATGRSPRGRGAFGPNEPRMTC
eukprot:10986741-Lingulodinium_polyedra.AAC.1